MFEWSTALVATCDFPASSGRKNRKKKLSDTGCYGSKCKEWAWILCQGNEFSTYRKRNGFPVTHCKSTPGNEHSVDILECLKAV